MQWYYADGDREVGPVTDADLDALAKSGRVRPQTLVWHDGMKDWQPYAGARGGPSQAAVLPPVIPDHPICSVCGLEFGKEDMILYNGALVCAGCKPSFFQGIQEGAMPRGNFEYVGFWMRFVAKIIDNVILLVPIFALLGLILIPVMSGRKLTPGMESTIQLVAQLSQLLFMVVYAAYDTWMVGRYGATAGKMLIGARVVCADGSPVSYKRAVARHFADMLNAATCFVGYILLAVDDEKRGLHDRICGTRVVHNR